MSTARRPGGYIDREHLARALRSNADMTALILRISSANNIPTGLAIPLMRFSALLAEQAAHLREMQLIRGERNDHV